MEIAAKPPRIYSLDLLRGLVMIIMALDHCRDFFHIDAFVHDPLDLSTTNTILYFTRWITNFCAPIFVFLAGISIFLQSIRKEKGELSIFLIKRGLWLIFIELFIVGFSWTFDYTFQLIILQVIWAIGISMFLMGFIIRLPIKAILVLGLIIVAGHNILDYIPETHSGFIWDLLHNGDFALHPISDSHKLGIIYPFLPWLGLMMLGFVFGQIYAPSIEASKRKKLLINSGLSLLAFFVILRFANIYGDPKPWMAQENPWYTFLSFINIHKYPPSLLYMCLNIGPALLFLAYFENSNNRLSKAVSVYGRVPFFYYILHFYFIHTLCMILFLTRGHGFYDVTPGMMGVPFKFLVPGEGYSLPVVYLIWIGIVLSLYPLCYWFSEYKKMHKQWWLSYL